jgi:hypothetical protein
MAEVTPSISSVTTLVVELECPPPDELIRRFAGRHTGRTLAAVRRIRTKKETVKVPRNLLRQLWRLTGGWKKEFSPGWGRSVPTAEFKVIAIGDLKVINRDYTTFLEYRGRKVASSTDWQFWAVDATRTGAFNALGVLYVPPPS